MTAEAQVTEELEQTHTQTAYHEAGHCLLAALCDIRVDDVWTQYQPGGLLRPGVRVHGLTRTHRRDFAAAQPYHHLLFSLGGPAAEAKWLHDNGFGSERYTRKRCLRENATDHKHAEQAARHCPDSRLRDADDDVFGLVCRHWSRVRDLAECLRQKEDGHLGGTAIHRALGL